MNIMTSQGGLNASIEYNISDEEKPLFDSPLPPIKWSLNDSPPFEDFPMLPKLNLRPDWQAQRYSLIKNRTTAFELSMPQPIHRTRSLFQEPTSTTTTAPITRPITQFTVPLKATKPKALGTLDNPIVLDDEEDNLGFAEVKGKYLVLDKIGEGKKGD
jgi:hypothetical protein